MIKYYKINSPQPIIDYLAQKISLNLKQGRVLWLVPGGSAIKVAVGVAEHLAGSSSHLDNLSVCLTDERYVDLGNADSNWKQLKDHGFAVPGAKLIPVLMNKGLAKTTANYKKELAQQQSVAGFSLALTGLGIDGHIFGIKPKSPAIDETDYVSSYSSDDFVRITSTFSLIKRLDEVIVYAVGEPKHRQLDKMEDRIVPSDQPAQILKNLKKVLIFNDYRGESI